MKHNISRFFALSVMLMISLGSINAQSRVIKGYVCNEMNERLSGAVIKLYDEDDNIITDVNGEFDIELSKDDKYLIVEHVGYSSKKVKLNDKNNFYVKLERDISKQFQEVNLIKDVRPSYSVGGAAIVITGDELRKTHNHRLSAALAGRVPGLYVKSTGNEPGKETYSLNLRGASTINGRSVLILIDGMIGGLDNINVNDVESVTIMKDASSTALYGMQAAAGIIYVKTKHGGISNSSINVDVNYTLQNPITTPKMVSSGDYATMLNQAWKNDGFGDYYIYSQDDIDNYYSGNKRDLFPNNNWYDMFLKNVVQTQNIHASGQGGSKYVKYYASLGYMHQDSPFKTGDALETYGLNRFDFRSNVDFLINDYIKGYVNIAARINKDLYPNAVDGTAGIMKSIFDMAPNVYGPLTPDGKVVVTPENTNPTYGRINRTGYVKGTDYNLSTNMGLEFDLRFILPGLKTSGNFIFFNNTTSQNKGVSDYERWTRDLTNIDELKFYQFGTTEKEPLLFSKSTQSSIRSQYDWNIDYDKRIKEHRIGANLFLSQQYYNANKVQGVQPVLRMTYGGRLSYGYKNLVFADVVASYQGSEQFSEGNRYGFFPSGSVAFVASNMDVLKNNDILTYLKLHASYGLVGNDAFGDDRFLYRDYLANATFNGGVNYLSLPIDIIRMGNPYLTWEKSKILDLGVDFSLFNQLSLGIDYYNDRRTDILVQDNLTPLVNGLSSNYLDKKNLGEIHNSGVDISLGYFKQLNKEFSLGINSNFGFNQNKIVELAELPKAKDYKCKYRQTGYRLNQNWGYEIDYSNGNGYFNSQKELDQSELTYVGKSPRLGDFIYKDQNEDKVIDEKDVVPIGETSIPQISWGAELFLKCKSWDLSVLFQGLGKFGGFNSGVGYYENYNNGTFFEQHLKAWTPERYANGEEILAPALTKQGSSSQKSNNYYYQNKGFARLKNIEVGYTLTDKSFMRKLNMNQLRFYVSGMNIFTWDHMKTNDIDVEAGRAINFPTSQYWTIGLNLNF